MTSFALRLRALADRVMQVLDYHRIDADRVPPSETVAHFTHWEACEAMLTTAIDSGWSGVSLWACDANCLNDPLEGRALIKFAEDHAGISLGEDVRTGSSVDGWPHSASRFGLSAALSEALMEDLPPETWGKMLTIVHGLYSPPHPSATGWSKPRVLPASEAYLVSFCSEKDRLDLWRPYGDDGKGVCMVMPLRSAARLATKSGWGFYRVMYDDRLMRRAWILLEKPLIAAWDESALLRPDERTPARRQILHTISSVLHLYKHHQFETEREIRLVYRGTRTPSTVRIRGDLRPILKTDPFFLNSRDCSIILGPTTPDRNRRIAALKVLLGQVFTRHTPEVQISGVPYQ